MKIKKWKIDDIVYYKGIRYQIIDILSLGKVRIKSTDENNQTKDVYATALTKIGKKPAHIFKIGDPVYYQAKMYFVWDMEDGKVTEISDTHTVLRKENEIGWFDRRVFPINHNTFYATDLFADNLKSLITPAYQECIESMEDKQIRNILIDLWESYCQILCYEPYSESEEEELKKIRVKMVDIVNNIGECIKNIFETKQQLHGQKSFLQKYINHQEKKV